MTTQFANPTIVELIAEVRWASNGSKDIEDAKAGSTFTVQTPQPELDAFLTRFSESVLALGFTSSERLVPQGVPSAPGQAVYRYRAPAHPGILVQAGWGVTTVNAIQPYKSWTGFAPRLKDVLTALIAARGENSEPFYHASVRYINAFGEAFREGKTPGEFVRDTLGFEVRLPAAIDEQRDPSEAPQAVIQLVFPTKNGMRARVTVGDGVAAGTQSLIYDAQLGVDVPVQGTADAVFAALDEEHSIIHTMFEGLIQPIRSLLQPKDEANDA